MAIERKDERERAWERETQGIACLCSKATTSNYFGGDDGDGDSSDFNGDD